MPNVEGKREAMTAKTEPTGATPCRILVVDDDQVDRMAVSRHLRGVSSAIEVKEAEGVFEAIELITTGAFDCVFLDFNLPDGDGLTFLRGLRMAGLDVPVVMLTGQSDPAVAVDLVSAGAADYIAKAALSPERLMEALAPLRLTCLAG
jgi:CheY-like chemotaxis protein